MALAHDECALKIPPRHELIRSSHLCLFEQLIAEHSRVNHSPDENTGLRICRTGALVGTIDRFTSYQPRVPI